MQFLSSSLSSSFSPLASGSSSASSSFAGGCPGFFDDMMEAKRFDAPWSPLLNGSGCSSAPSSHQASPALSAFESVSSSESPLFSNTSFDEGLSSSSAAAAGLPGFADDELSVNADNFGAAYGFDDAFAPASFPFSSYDLPPAPLRHLPSSEHHRAADDDIKIAALDDMPGCGDFSGVDFVFSDAAHSPSAAQPSSSRAAAPCDFAPVACEITAEPACVSKKASAAASGPARKAKKLGRPKGSKNGDRIFRIAAALGRPPREIDEQGHYKQPYMDWLISRHREKRQQHRAEREAWIAAGKPALNKRLDYPVRQKQAEKRARIGGRFASKKDMAALGLQPGERVPAAEMVVPPFRPAVLPPNSAHNSSAVVISNTTLVPVVFF